jgi:hypothetical protein
MRFPDRHGIVERFENTDRAWKLIVFHWSALADEIWIHGLEHVSQGLGYSMITPTSGLTSRSIAKSFKG